MRNARYTTTSSEKENVKENERWKTDTERFIISRDTDDVQIIIEYDSTTKEKGNSFKGGRERIRKAEQSTHRGNE